MKYFILNLFLIVMLSGCTERYFNGPGAEYLVYPETHTYAFSVISSTQTQQQLEVLLTKVQEIDPGASYVITYRNAKGKRVVTEALKTFPKLALSAEDYSVGMDASQSKDIVVIITYHSLVTQKCDIPRIEGAEFSRNCFSESARVRQVAHKERLVEGI